MYPILLNLYCILLFSAYTINSLVYPINKQYTILKISCIKLEENKVMELNTSTSEVS